MNVNELENYISNKVGSSIVINEEEIFLSSYERTKNGFTLITKDGKLDISFDQARAMILIERSKTPAITGIPPVTVVNTATLTTVRNALLDTLKQVQNDKSYVPQANAIVGIAKSLTEIAKTEIIALKMSRD